MYTRILIFVALVFAIAAAPTWGQCTPVFTTVTDDVAEWNCTNTFAPGTTQGVWDFRGTGDGYFVIQFDTVLTTFTLNVAVNHNIDPIDIPNSFPTGTQCIPYNAVANTIVNGNTGECDQYDVSGSSTGPNGVPVKDVDYRGLVTVTLNYNSFASVDIPAFGHAPGDNATAVYSEDILTSYVDENAPPCTPAEVCDPTMGGKTPGISSFAALNEPFANGAPTQTVCFLKATAQNSTSGNNPIVEVTFQLVPAGGSCTTGPFLRDKTATLTVGTLSSNGTITFTNLVNNGDSNKFHFDNTSHLNVQDINTNGLPSGTYIVTVISEVFSPVTTRFTK